jgi:hypothetical protein
MIDEKYYADKEWEEKLKDEFPEGKIISDMVLEKLPNDTEFQKWEHVYRCVNYKISHMPAFADRKLPNALCAMFEYLKKERLINE